MAHKITEFSKGVQELLRKQMKKEDDAKRNNIGVGAVETNQPQRSPALVKEAQGKQTVHNGVAYRVSLVAFLRNKWDDDNVTASLKPLRDAVAFSLGVDDGSSRIVFETGQFSTNGEEGVLVVIEKYDQK